MQATEHSVRMTKNAVVRAVFTVPLMAGCLTENSRSLT